MKKSAVAKILEHRSTERAEPTAGVRGGKPRLLLVDDEPHVLEGLALFLRRRFDIVARTSGSAALVALDDEGPFAAVLADLRMPGMDGVELLAEVKRRSPATSRLLLTGHGDLDAAVAAVNEAAVHRFLTKPCPPARLAAALEEALAATAAEDKNVVGERLAQLGRQAALGSMAGSIGHEIGNLVAALAGSVELVREQIQNGETPAAEDIGLFDLVRMRLGEHAKHLKHLSRPRTSVIEEVEIGTLVCNAKALLDHAGILRIARVEVALPNEPVYVRADAMLLEGVLINLLKNAAEALESDLAGPFGRGEEFFPAIHIGVTAKQGRMSLEVADNGPGIAEADLAHLFDAYYTTKSPEKGTGLGLAIVRETLARQGGTVWVESVVGRGTKFVVELPLSGAHGPQPKDPVTPQSTLRLVR
jgi:C4-dicarboxylate-specific signal transduction histidine kinase